MNSASNIPDVVLYSFFPWKHEYPSTAHGLARALARYTRVWFVSKPPTWKDAAKGKSELKPWSQARVREAAGFSGSLMLVDLPPTFPINGFAPGKAYNTLQKFVDIRLNNALDQVFKDQGIDQHIWINLYAPTQFKTLGKRPRPLQRFYYSVDAIGQANYTGKHGVEAEKEQLLASDAGLATSSKLAEDLAAFAKTITVLPNAMDASNYLSDVVHAEPKDLVEIEGPRVGYIGNLDGARLDFEGLEVLAKTRPDVNFVLIGPWNAGETLKHKISALTNIHLLGSKAPDACPAYLQHMDCGIIPFRCTALTAAIYPLKINEYLALGLPVLSTSFSTDIQSFGDLITLGSVESWQHSLAEVLSPSSEEEIQKRKQRAAKNRWIDRAQSFLALAGYENEPVSC